MDSKFIISKLVGTLIRHGLSTVSAWLMAKGLGVLDEHTQANLSEIIIGAVCMGFTLGWSYVRSHLQGREMLMLQTVLQRFRGSAVQSPIVKALFLSFLLGSMTSCALVSGFDQNTYNSALELKGESVSLMGKAIDPASAHQDEINALMSKLSAQVAYEEGKGKANLISLNQWKLLTSEEKDLLGGFLKKWKEDRKFSPSFINEKTKQVSDAFDEILKLEGAKSR